MILDSDLAALYGVATERLNKQVRRNPGRFPSDFMFLLTNEEWDFLKSQSVTSRKTGRRRHRRFLPYVFTIQGALMAAGLVRSKHAIEVSIYIARAIVASRESDRGPFEFLTPGGR